MKIVTPLSAITALWIGVSATVVSSQDAASSAAVPPDVASAAPPPQERSGLASDHGDDANLFSERSFKVRYVVVVYSCGTCTYSETTLSITLPQ